MSHHALLGRHLSLEGSAAQFSLAGTLRPLGSGVVAAWGWDGRGREPDPSLGALRGLRDFASFSQCSFSTAHLSGGGHPAPYSFSKDPPHSPLVLKILCIGTHLFNKY